MTDHKPFTAEQLDRIEIRARALGAVGTLRLIAQAREEIRLRGMNAALTQRLAQLEYAAEWAVTGQLAKQGDKVHFWPDAVIMPGEDGGRTVRHNGTGPEVLNAFISVSRADEEFVTPATREEWWHAVEREAAAYVAEVARAKRELGDWLVADYRRRFHAYKRDGRFECRLLPAHDSPCVGLGATEHEAIGEALRIAQERYQ